MIEELDIGTIRRDFPILKKVVFLCSAAVGPMPRPTLNKMTELLRKAYIDYEENYWELEWEKDVKRRCRRSAGKLINAEPIEVALVKSTTEGINAFASGITWREGDNLILNDLEYPANVIPWYNQARRHGLEVRVVENVEGRVPLEKVAEAIDERTKVIAVSHVEFGNGFKHDVKELSRIAHENDAFLFVDAIQSVGAIRVDVKELGMDALSAGGYKWVCGPVGTGIAYVRKGIAETVRPSYVGYGSIDENEWEELWENLVAGTPWVRDYRALSRSARRFEYGSLGSINLKGLQTSIDYLLDLGLDRIEHRIITLTDYLLGRLGEMGFEVLTPRGKNERAGIVSFKPGVDLKDRNEREKLRRRLLDRGVRVDVRGGGIRVACHFFNTEDDLEKMLEAVDRICQ